MPVLHACKQAWSTFSGLQLTLTIAKLIIIIDWSIYILEAPPKALLQFSYFPSPHLRNEKLARDEQSPQQVVSAVISHLIDGHLNT